MDKYEKYFKTRRLGYYLLQWEQTATLVAGVYQQNLKIYIASHFYQNHNI